MELLHQSDFDRKLYDWDGQSAHLICLETPLWCGWKKRRKSLSGVGGFSSFFRTEPIASLIQWVFGGGLVRIEYFIYTQLLPESILVCGLFKLIVPICVMNLIFR